MQFSFRIPHFWHPDNSAKTLFWHHYTLSVRIPGAGEGLGSHDHGGLGRGRVSTFSTLGGSGNPFSLELVPNFILDYDGTYVLRVAPGFFSEAQTPGQQKFHFAKLRWNSFSKISSLKNIFDITNYETFFGQENCKKKLVLKNNCWKTVV